MTFVRRWLLTAVVLLASPIGAGAPGGSWEAYWRAGVQAREQGRYAQAETMLSAAVTTAEGVAPPDERLVASLIDLARLYRQLHKYAEAEPLARRAGEIEEQIRGPQHPGVARILVVHAAILRALGRDAEVTDVEARLRAILARPSVRGPAMRWERAGATEEDLDADERACALETQYGTTAYGPLIDPDRFTRCIEQRGWREKNRPVEREERRDGGRAGRSLESERAARDMSNVLDSFSLSPAHPADW